MYVHVWVMRASASDDDLCAKVEETKLSGVLGANRENGQITFLLHLSVQINNMNTHVFVHASSFVSLNCCLFLTPLPFIVVVRFSLRRSQQSQRAAS